MAGATKHTIGESVASIARWIWIWGFEDTTTRVQSFENIADQESLSLEAEISALFHEMRVSLLRYLLSLGLGIHDGEDVTQEVFLALYCHLRAGKPRDNLRAWLFRVAHNLGLKRRKASGRATSRSERDFIFDSHADPRPDPERQYTSNQRQEQLAAAMRALPERDRWCLSLRAEGLRFREIAEALDISIGSVANSLSRSLSKLNEAAGR